MKTKTPWKLPNTTKPCWICEELTEWKFQDATQESICTRCGEKVNKIWQKPKTTQ